MQSPSQNSWSRIPIARIEDLSDAVYGAGLEATQMTTGSLSGSLVFAQQENLVLTSGYIDGTVALQGPLSLDMVTFGIGLRVPPGTWHWMDEVATGDIGVFLPGDDHDSRYMPGSLYATLSINMDELEAEAAALELNLRPRALDGTGFHPYKLPADTIDGLRNRFEFLHTGIGSSAVSAASISQAMLSAIIHHYGAPPFATARKPKRCGQARIIAKARAYIMEHLDEPMSLNEIASAAHTSRRTLQRAFADVYDDTPKNYVRRLRLHRIRRDLAGDAERACTVALISNQWGIGEIGRMSGWYRELFGEAPSRTLARGRA